MNLTLEVCCLWLTLMSAAGSDLNQTAYFTAQYRREGNPLVEHIVDAPSRSGELYLGLAGVGAVYLLERNRRLPRWTTLSIEAVWTAGHLYAINNNQKNRNKAEVLILIPTITVRF